MLSIKKRKQYLKYIGLYNGTLDDKNTALYREAVRKLQNTYFPERLQTGKYAGWTEILLRNAVRVKRYTTNFELKEFACGCGGKYCSKYPKLISIDLLKYLQQIRDYYKEPIYISSSLRCLKYNDSLRGSISNSEHTLGKAVDFYTSSTTSLDYRKKLIDYFIKKTNANYSYCDGYYRTKAKKGSINASYMDDSIHIDVK